MHWSGWIMLLAVGLSGGWWLYQQYRRLSIEEQTRYAALDPDPDRVVRENLDYTVGDTHILYIFAQQNQAIKLIQAQKYAEAEAIYQRIMHYYQKFDPANQANVLVAWQHYAVLLLEQGEISKAEHHLNDILAKQTALLGANHDNTLSTIQTLAQCMLASERYSEAESYYRQIIHSFDDLASANDLKGEVLFFSLVEFANFLVERKSTEALLQYQRLLELQKIYFADQPQFEYYLKERLAFTQYAVMDNPELAIEQYRNLLAEIISKYGKDNKYYLRTGHFCAVVLDETGQPAEACELLEQIYPHLNDHFATDDPFVYHVAFNYITSLSNNQQPEPALVLAEALIKELGEQDPPSPWLEHFQELQQQLLDQKAPTSA
ncbi:tetratricopeptide repeat protein [Herpetosiphon llansteffanensis]|uniref:tetratricopeptide repeat protein n=1 Tax=Herpetosiphon llansteffanensis TaxID=2094568 RepID=UPI000D7D02EB|nr:tetratricopeptide repeat protein [Herpetosiphon llansteffanensis]